MDLNNTHSFLISFLSVLAVFSFYSIQGAGLSPTASDYVSGEKNHACKKLNPQATTNANLPSEINNSNKETSAPTNSTPTTNSCNTSVQMVSVGQQYLHAPIESKIVPSTKNAILASQIFVFQEPDPPRLG